MPPLRRVVATAAAAAVLAGACGGEPPAPPPPPPLAASALPGLALRDRPLPPGELSQDALEPAGLAALLEDERYLGGTEREFSGHTDTFDHVIARTLVFADSAGAEAYLDWVALHPDDLAGPSFDRGPIAGSPGRSILFELRPCTTCKKQLPTWFGAWTDGATVSYLLAAGRDVDRLAFRRLARLVAAAG